MSTSQDDSTDDEIGVNLQLAERLSINKGDHVASNKSLPNSKALKQLHNYQRRNLQDYKSSSSSSSLDTQSDPLVLESSSSYGLHNKKRQNGDKNIEQFNNSKRTCLSDRLLRSADWKLNGSDIPEVMHYSPQPVNSSVKKLYPDKTYEDHLNNMSDDDSDFQPRRCLPSKNAQGAGKSARTFRGLGLPKTVGKLFENQPSGSGGVHFIDSTSDDDSRTVLQNGALKGGRQSPEFSDKKRWSHKIAKVSDSDSDDLPVDYRSRPVIFSSSSDSDDCRPSDKINKKSNSASKKSANPSFPSVSSHEPDHSYYFPDQIEPVDSRCNGDGPKHYYYSSVLASPADHKIKNSSTKSSKVHAKPSSSHQNSYPVTNDVESSFQGRGNSRSRKSHSKSPSSSQSRTLHSHRHFGIRKSPKGISGPRQNQVLPADQSRSNMYNGNDSSNTQRSSEFQPEHFSPVSLSMTSYHPRDGIHSIRSVSRPITGRRMKANSRKAVKGRCLNGACSQTDNNLASIYPDLFDAEDSSEVEFFTANSYSDNESNTETFSLRVNANYRTIPIPRQEALSDNPVNVASSEDEISVVYSSAPRDRILDSRRTARTLGRRCRRGPQGFRSSNQDVVSLSPDPVEQVRQVEEDERFARMLQAQFDAEIEPTYAPCRIPSPLPPINTSGIFFSSGDDDSSLDLQMDTESFPANRTNFDSLSVSPVLRGLHVRLSRLPLSPAFYSSGRRPNTRNRRRIPDMETHFMNWNPSTAFNLFNFGGSDDSYETFLGLAELTGEVSRGLQRNEINRLPTRKYVVPNGASSSRGAEVPHRRAELNKECQVCLNDYVNGDVLRILPCFHEFHTPCIDPWLKINHTCPVCRVIVNLEQ